MDDAWSRSAYRRLVDWDRRLEREGPALRAWWERAPDRSVVDLGCGTGEHVAFFARLGARAVGLDVSPSMIEDARDHERRGEGRFLVGDACDADRLLAGEPRFGLALCLGNVLPHFRERERLASFLRSVRRLLVDGGLLVAQWLDYERLRARGQRFLTPNVRRDEDGTETVFLRMLTFEEEGGVVFHATTLRVDAGAATPVTVERSRRVDLRAWPPQEVAALATAAGFEPALHGDLEGGPLEGGTSDDVVLAARAGPSPPDP